jgi:hypothetical protein
MRATLFLENKHFKPVNIKVWQPKTPPDCRGNSTKQPNFKKKHLRIKCFMEKSEGHVVINRAHE